MFERSTKIKLEKRVKELEKLAVKKEVEYQQFIENLVTNISHEIRTPLNGIAGFSSLLNSGEFSDKKSGQFIKHINDSTEKLVYLVDNLIELSYLQTGRMKLKSEKCSISEILKSAFYYVNYLKNKHDKNDLVILSNESVYVNDKEDVYVDYARLLIVLKNLLNNSVKFTSKGSIEFGCTRKPELLEFFVKDTGIGIDEMDNDLFKEFSNIRKQPKASSNNGLGIGLSVCKGIIRNMGGKIWFTSNKNGGTNFYFTMPYEKLNTDVDRYLSKAHIS